MRLVPSGYGGLPEPVLEAARRAPYGDPRGHWRKSQLASRPSIARCDPPSAWERDRGPATPGWSTAFLCHSAAGSSHWSHRRRGASLSAKASGHPTRPASGPCVESEGRFRGPALCNATCFGLALLQSRLDRRPVQTRRPGLGSTVIVLRLVAPYHRGLSAPPALDERIEGRREDQTETGDAEHSEEHGGAEGLPHLRPGTRGDHKRHDTQDEGKRCHQDRSQPRLRGM